MEIGPLSEWIGALASFLAVLVALFLPYYQRRMEDKLQIGRLKRLILDSINKIINTKNPDEKEKLIKKLKQILSINYYWTTSQTKINLLIDAKELLNILGSSDPSMKKINYLKKELKNNY